MGAKTPEPGRSESVQDPSTVKGIKNGLAEFGSQLSPFFASGGILVIKLVLPATIYYPYGDGTLETADSHGWLLNAIPTFAKFLRSPTIRPVFFLHGAGSSVEVTEPGHPVADSLIGSSYEARISPTFGPLVDVLARNRTGDPVAAEIRVGEGSAIIVPASTSNNSLKKALTSVLAGRSQIRDIWRPDDEVRLAAEEAAFLADFRRQRQQFVDGRAVIRSITDQVFAEIDVSRAIAFYRNGSDPQRTIKSAMVELYKLVELLEDLHGGSEDGLATALGITKSKFKAIKKLANQKEFDFRHTKAGQPVGADAAEIEQARANALDLLKRFLTDRYQERRAAHEHKGVGG